MVLAKRFHGKDEYIFTTPGMEAAPGHPGPHAALLHPWRAEVEQRRGARLHGCRSNYRVAEGRGPLPASLPHAALVFPTRRLEQRPRWKQAPDAAPARRTCARSP